MKRALLILSILTLLSACAQRGGQAPLGQNTQVVEKEAKPETVDFCEAVLKQFNQQDYKSFLKAFDDKSTLRKLKMQLGSDERYQAHLPGLPKRIEYVLNQLSDSLTKFNAKEWYGIDKDERKAANQCVLYSELVKDNMSIIRIKYREFKNRPLQITEVEELTSGITVYSRTLTLLHIMTMTKAQQRSFSVYLKDLDQKPIKQRVAEFRRLPAEFKSQGVGLVPLFNLVDAQNAEHFTPLVDDFVASQINPYDSFFLQNYWLHTKQYDKVKNLIDRLREKIGPSVPIDLFSANLEFELGDRKLAYRHYSDFIERNMDFEDGYWALLGALMQDDRHDEAVLTLTALEKYFGYSFAGVEFNEPAMKQFNESAAYKNWISVR